MKMFEDIQLQIIKLTQSILTHRKITVNNYKIRAEILQETNLCKISDIRYQICTVSRR